MRGTDLRRMHLLKDLSLHEIRAIGKVLVPHRLKKGQRIIQQRARGGTLYMVRMGELKVIQMIRGKQRELGVFRAGDHFGELSFIDGKPRSATILAARNSELLALRRVSFERLVKDHPATHIKLQTALLNDLSRKMRERHFQLDADLSDVLPVSVFELDAKGDITFANRSGLKSFRYSESDFDSGMNVMNLIAPAERSRIRAHFRKLKLEKEVLITELLGLRKDGTTFPTVTHWDPIPRGARLAGARATIVDISERKRMEEALRLAHADLENKVRERTVELRESEERYALAVSGANDGLWDWNLSSKKVYYSPRWKKMLGYEEDQVGDSLEEWMARVHREDLRSLEVAIAAHRDGVSPHLEVEYRILHQDGAYRWMLCRGLAVRAATGIAYRMAGSQTDITGRKRMEEQLIQNAFYDSLTSLPNRALFMDRLAWSMERARQYERTGKNSLFAVLYLDLDRFKVVNDSFGHVLGDQLLSEVAKRLQLGKRPGDTVARMGGDEFALLLDQIREKADSTRVARRILEAFSAPFSISGRDVYVSASMGIAFSVRSAQESAAGARYENAQEMLRDADIAMYRAKSRGGATYQVFESGMHMRVVEAMELENDLRHAVSRKECINHYQPIVSLSTGTICGFEALLRWRHPQRGLLSPGSFIAAAEDTGLIIPLGEQVLQQACSQVRSWNSSIAPTEPLFVSVNVSGKQLMQQNYFNRVEKVLQEVAIPRDWLRLEITESVMIENSQSIIQLMNRLRSLGLHLGLDDFGTGYSSLSSLRRFPIGTLKIDASFVREMHEQPGNLKIVKTIIGLARILEMSVVAEGVETSEQLSTLRELECDSAQGYYFSPPLDPDEASVLLRSGQKW